MKETQNRKELYHVAVSCIFQLVRNCQKFLSRWQTDHIFIFTIVLCFSDENSLKDTEIEWEDQFTKLFQQSQQEKMSAGPGYLLRYWGMKEFRIQSSKGPDEDGNKRSD